MKNIIILAVAFICSSFCPSAEDAENLTHNGYYITVEDFTTRTSHKYIVETKDSVNAIFSAYFKSELDLGEVDRPISIYNGKHDVYIARVNVFVKANGKKGFRNLKYPPVYVTPKKRENKTKRAPVYMEF